MTGRWKVVRDFSLLFCAALAVYLTSIILGARVGIWLVNALPPGTSALPRLLLGTAVVDLCKAPALLLLSLVLAPALTVSPTVAALVLTGFTYALELLTGLALGALTGLGVPAVLAARLLAASLLVLAARWILRRRRMSGGPPAPPAERPR